MAFDYDILVIGGGANGCGVARDAAGYKVLLAEMNDLASGTSSASTKLIHGGAPHHLLACMVEIDADSRVVIHRRGGGTLALFYHLHLTMMAECSSNTAKYLAK